MFAQEKQTMGKRPYSLTGQTYQQMLKLAHRLLAQGPYLRASTESDHATLKSRHFMLP
jgi:hypothetical protein